MPVTYLEESLSAKNCIPEGGPRKSYFRDKFIDTHLLTSGINKCLSAKNIIEVITVKKKKSSEFFKGKGYYALLFVGVIAIAAVALIGSNLSSGNKEKDQNQVDLNEPDNNIAANDNNQVADNIGSDQFASNEQGNMPTAMPTAMPTGTKANDTDSSEAADNTGIEYEDYSTQGETASNQTAENTDVAAEEPESVATSGNTVKSDSVPLLSSLSFNSEEGLAWPVIGNVLMNYSMDHTIYYATLKSFKCNPAIIIDAEVGENVKAAAKGVVTSIENNPETGWTVTTNIGDGYNLIYGQMDEDSLTVDVGDKVNEGDVIGEIAEPSRFYSVEGSNLYFKVLENDTTVNPMMLLRDSDEQ